MINGISFAKNYTNITEDGLEIILACKSSYYRYQY